MTTRTLDDLLLRYRRLVIVSAHLAGFLLALWMAYQLRFDFQVDRFHARVGLQTAWVFVAIKLFVFGLLRQYSGWWRYLSLRDGLRMIQASLISGALVTATIFVIGLPMPPRSVLVLDPILTVAIIASMRVSIRMFRERLEILNRTVQKAAGASTRSLLVGTGRTAESIVRDATHNRSAGIDIVGVVDPDNRLVGTRMFETPIVGTLDDLERLVKDHAIDQVILAVEGSEGALVRDIVARCNALSVQHRIIPTVDALLHGKVSLSSIREVNLEDLLGRAAVRLETEQIARLITGHTVLVTGAGGSIGSELCRQVARFGPARIVLLEQAENPLFHLERELAPAFPDVELVPVIADIHDGHRLRHIVAHHRPEIVLHAAAHKHVPLMERNPSEAIKNNIIGTLNLIEAVQAADVEVCVLISTDKAVNPTSVMGASKRFAEMLLQSLMSRSRTRLCAVRFGNVLGSNGSVIPIFQQQIAAGGPVTVTHPDMRRYFMTIPEASQLVLQAATYAREGDIFVLDMGEPVHIVDVARDLIRLSGFEPDRDIRIEFSGIRPGEKLFEELSGDNEETDATDHSRIMRCRLRRPDLDTLLDAVRRLEDIAESHLPAAHVRAAIFDFLAALEVGDPLPTLRPEIANVVALKATRNA